MHDSFASSRRWLFRAGACALLIALSACATRRGVEPPGPVSLDEAEIEAIAELLRLEDRREFDSLVFARHLEASSPVVRGRAVLTTARLRAPGSVGLLLPRLTDADSSVAVNAAFGLGQLGDSTAVPQLAALLEPRVLGRRPTVAAEAARALGRLPSEAAGVALVEFLTNARGDDRSRPAVGSALLSMWKRSENLPDAVERWTRSPDPEVRWRATYALARRPRASHAHLLERLSDDSDLRVRALALRGLTAPLVDSAGLSLDSTRSRVVGLLADPAYSVRVNAVRSLGTYSHPAAIDTLAGVLLGDDHHLAFTAAEVLGTAGAVASRAAPRLAAVAGDDALHLALRVAALDALGTIGATEARTLARAFQRRPEWRARAAAARAYARLQSRPHPELLKLLRDKDGRVAANALTALLESAGEAPKSLRPQIVDALGSRDVMVRTEALVGLATIASARDLPLALEAYGRAQADTTNDAALAAVDLLSRLGELGVPAERSFFRRFKPSTDPVVRKRVYEEFGEAARVAWGDPYPITTALGPEDYRTVVDRYVVPALRDRKGPRVVLETTAGEIEMELSGGESPLTTRNFIRLAEQGFFDGQEWPRVVANFVVQGGDPRGDTSGGPGYSIRDELGRAPYLRGSVGMALAGPDTGGSQFFITHSPQPHLDSGYTLFGRVVRGMEAAEQLLPWDALIRVRVLSD